MSEHKVIILMYHRVAEMYSDPWSLCVSPQNFAQQLAVLKKYSNVIRLSQLADDLRSGEISDRSVVVTFDDGYADNLHNARPLLEQQDVPATLFVATGYLGRRELWWDELQRIFLSPGKLPGTLRLNVRGQSHQYDLTETAEFTDQACRIHRNWRAWTQAPTARHSIYYAVWNILRPLSDDERHPILDELRAWANSNMQLPSDGGMLSIPQLSVLVEGGLFDAGCHTASHPRLSATPAAKQREEIEQSKADLETILNQPVKCFAYPYGGSEDYTAESVALVQTAGFESACSTIPGVVSRHSDLYQLPRFQVEDWSGEDFARQLSLWYA